ncbi:MAG: ABC transporter permease [Planctomycetota bacterium]
MGPAFSWALALRYLTSRWVNVLGMLGVAVAVWALVVVVSVFSGFIADIRAEVRRSAPDLLVTGLPFETGFERVRRALADDPDVVAMAPRLRHYGVMLRDGEVTTLSNEIDFNAANNFVQLLGVDPALEREVTPFDEWVEAGRHAVPTGADHGAPPLAEDLRVPDAVEYFARRRAGLPVPDRVEDFRSMWPGMLLGRNRARREGRGLMLGSPLQVFTVDFTEDAEAGKVLSLNGQFAFAGAFRTGSTQFDDATAIVAIEPVRTLLGHDALDDASVDLCTDVAIRATAGLSIEQLRTLGDRLLPRVLAALPQPLPPEAHPEVLTWEQQNQVFLDAVDTERSMMTVVLFAVMLIAAFLIYATLNMMVTQKVKDIGILTALGGAPRGVGQIFTRCGLVIGAVGAGAGVLLGLLTLWQLNAMNEWLFAHIGFELFPRTLFDLPKVPYRVDPEWVVGVAVFAFLLTLLVAWIPARKAARMHPVEALSYE